MRTFSIRADMARDQSDQIVAQLQGNRILDPSYQLMLEEQDHRVVDANLQSRAEMQGEHIVDRNFQTLGDVAEAKRMFDGGETMIAVGLFELAGRI